MALTIRGYPRRVVFDWSPAAGEHAAWLALLEGDGWELDYGSAPEGSPVLLGGQEVLRYAMRESEPARLARCARKARDRAAAALAARPAGTGEPEVFEGGWWQYVEGGSEGWSGDRFNAHVLVDRWP